MKFFSVPNHSSKSFKPQLEDIKSSNLLLNKDKKTEEKNGIQYIDNYIISKIKFTLL